MADSELSSVWKRQVVKLGGASGASKDLLESLQGQGSHPLYVPAKPDWPEWLVPSSTAMSALPKMVLDRYQNRPQVCFFNALPEINRAWASIDNSLFLWKLNQKEPVPAVYNSEEQPICCVGLATPLPGIFLAAIRHVLVVCTTVEIVLVGICFSDGTINGEVLLTALTGYSIPSDNVTMCSIAATSSGRIFLGGADGHLYEVVYGKNGRMRKVCQTTSFLKLLPGYMTYFIGVQTAPLDALIVDNTRNLLYTLSQGSVIQLFYLGRDGKGPVQRVAEVLDFQACAQAAPGGNQVFRPSEKKGARVVHLAVIPPHLSSRVHVVAITEDARRVFFSTYRPQGARSGANAPPNCLKAEVCWGNDSLAGSAARSGHGAAQGAQRPLNIEQTITALYSSNTLLLAERATGDGSLSKILCTFPNYAQNPTGDAQPQSRLGAQINVRLSEVVSEIPAALPGEVNVIAELPQPNPYAPLLSAGLCDERQLQLLSPPPRFLIMSTAGMLELTRNRPIEALQVLLLRRNATIVRQFFADVGPAEACALCFMLATPSGRPQSAPADVAMLAEQCLADVSLVGVPEWRAENPANYAMSGYGTVTDESEPEWSSMHHGLCIVLYRVLHQVWDAPLLTIAKGTTDVRAMFPMPMLELLQLRLQELARVVERVLDRMLTHLSSVDFLSGNGRNRALPAPGAPLAQQARREPAFNIEHAKVSELRDLAQGAAEALLLVRKLTQHHIVRLLHQSRQDLERSLSRLRLCELLTHDGRTHVKALLLDLLKRHIRDGTVPYSLSQELLEGCKSFFPYHHEIYLRAFGKLERTNKPDMPRHEREEIAQEFLAAVTEVPAAVELAETIPLLAKLDMYEGVVKLCVRKADALDVGAQSMLPGAEGEHASQQREAHYSDLLALAVNLASARSPAAHGSLQTLLTAASASGDKVMLHALFRRLIAMGHGSLLVRLLPASEELQRHLLALGAVARPYTIPWAELSQQLLATTTLDGQALLHMRLLADLYTERREYAHAVEIWAFLGRCKVAPSVPADQRPNRVQCFQSAILHAKSVGEEAVSDAYESDLQLALLQKMTLEALQQKGTASATTLLGATSADSLAAQIAELESSFVDVSTLFNTYAMPNQLWSICLLLLQFSQHDNEGDIRQAWDLLLKDAVESCYAARASGAPQAGTSTAPSPLNDAATQGEATRRVCALVQDLALRLFPSPWFPEAHVLTRLLQIETGLWPEGGASPAADGPEVVAQAMLGAMQQRHALLLPLFERVLCQPVALVADPEVSQLARHPPPWTTLLSACQAYLAALRRQTEASGSASYLYMGGGAEAPVQEMQALQDMLIVFANQADAAPALQYLAAEFRRVDAEVRSLLGRTARPY